MMRALPKEKDSHMRTIELAAIIRHYGTGPGRHWFDKDSCRFFRTRLPESAFQTTDGSRAYFVSSEKPPRGNRAYSVRAYDFAARDISTIGTFCGYATRGPAITAARNLAKGS